MFVRNRDIFANTITFFDPAYRMSHTVCGIIVFEIHELKLMKFGFSEEIFLKDTYNLVISS